MTNRSVFSILASVLVVSSLAIAGLPVAAAAGEVSDIDVYASGDDDRDGDGKYSRFEIGVTADTRVSDGFTDASDPFLKIYVNDQLMRTTDVSSEAGFYQEFEFSRAELAAFDSGTPSVTVELWDDDLIGNTLESKFGHTPAIEFEPRGEDYSDKKRALIGISSITGSYEDAGEYLNVDTLQSEQIGFVTDAFEALLPLSPEDVRDAAAISLLEQLSSAAADAVDTAITAPAVINNVGKSLEAGKQANALQNTDVSTRSEFHRHLNDLAAQDVSTNPNEMSEAELRERKATLEEAYESTTAYRASVRQTWDTGALRDNVPWWMAELYGADQETLTKIQGQFMQLEQLLITDYYYTQKALNPDSNIQPQNLTTATTPRKPSYPTANIVTYDTPETVTVGETASVSVTVETKNSGTPSQTITIGLPDDDSVKNVRVTENTIEEASYSTVYPAGSELWTGYGDSKEQIPYTVVETAGPMSAGSTHTFEIQFEPTTADSIRVWSKSIAWTDDSASGGLSPYPRGDPRSRDTLVTDGQDELAEQRRIEVIEPAPAQFDITSVETNSPVQTGREVTATATITNSGDLTGTADIEFAVPGVGRDEQSVRLNGGASKSVEFVIQTDNADAGAHTATVSTPDSSRASSITIDQANRPPTASDMSLSTDQEATVSRAFAANDPDGDSLSYAVISQPTNGRVSVTSGSFSYTPASGYVGDDAFRYRVRDGNGESDTATVSIRVDAVNSQPAADDIDLATDANSTVAGTFVANDPDGDSLSYSVVMPPNNGDVSTDGASFEYTPKPGYAGDDAFRYRVDDGNGGSDTATVSVSIDTALAPASFDVSIIEASTPITAGETLNLTARVKNTGEAGAVQPINLDAGAIGSDSTTVSLAGGETTTTGLSLQTDTTDNGTYTAVVSSTNTTAQRAIEVHPGREAPFFNITLTDSETPVDVGDPVEVSAEIQNTGDTKTTQTVEFTAGSLGERSVSVSLAGGTKTTESFSLPTTDGDTGTYPAVISSANQSVSKTIAVTESKDENDRYAPNDGVDTAAPLSAGSHPNLRIVDGEDDYFAVTLAANESLTASVAYGNSSSDLGLALYGPNKSRLDRNTSTGGTESVAASGQRAPGPYYIHVYGQQGATTAYNLSISVGSAATGVITGDVVTANATEVAGANVTLLKRTDTGPVKVDAAGINQQNPVTTGPDGTYVFAGVETSYDYRVEADFDSRTGAATIPHLKRGTTTANIVIPESAGQPLTVDAGGPYSVQAGQALELNASTDSGGQITEIDWRVVDGLGSVDNRSYTVPESAPTGTQVTVAVTVTDGTNNTDTDTAVVEIKPQTTPSDGEYVYRVPFVRNEQKLPSGMTSELRVTAQRTTATVAVDYAATGTTDKTKRLDSGETASFAQPPPGSVVRSTAPVAVTYRYQSPDFGAYEDDRQQYGVPEASLLGEKYYLPINADQLSIAATAATELRVDQNGDGTFERTTTLAANGVETVATVQPGARVVADAPVHVVAERSDWESMDDTYLTSLLPTETAPQLYEIPAEPDYSRQAPTGKTGVYLAGTQNGTTVTTTDNETAAITLEAGEVHKIETTSELTIEADAPVVAVYAYHVEATDPWASTKREYIGATTPVSTVETRQGSWSGTSEAVSVWSTYNRSALSDEEPASASIFEVRNVDPVETSVTPGESFNVSTTIENTGSTDGTEVVTLRVGPRNGTVVTQTLDLAAGSTTSIMFNNVSVPDVSAVETTGAANYTVATPSDVTKDTLNIKKAPEPLQLEVSDVPQTVQPGTTFTMTYEVANLKENVTAYTLQTASATSNLTVVDFSGDLESSNIGADPPGASTTGIAPSDTASVIVTYRAQPDATGTVTVNTTAVEPLSQTRVSTSHDVSVETAPTGPRERALQATGKATPSELTQNDVTAMITRFDRGQTANGIAIRQNDITAVITLFERN
jgi:hypothetical protein